MKKLLVGAVLCSAMVCGSAHADEASKRTKIGELFVLMHMQQSIDQLLEQQQKQVRTMLPGMFPNVHFTAAQQKQFDALMERVSGITHEALDWNKLQPKFVDLYATTYDEATIDGILNFYRSDAGKTMIAKQPELIGKSQKITQDSMIAVQPQMREALQQFAVELQKSQPESQPAPATK